MNDTQIVITVAYTFAVLHERLERSIGVDVRLF